MKKSSYLQYLDEGDCEVEVHCVAKVQRQRHEQPHGHYSQHVEAQGHACLDLHQSQHLHFKDCLKVPLMFGWPS